MYHTSWIWSKLLFSLDDLLPMTDLVLHFCGFWDVEREMKACTVNPWWRERGRNECSLSFRHPNILEVIPMFGLVHKGKGAMGPHEIFLFFFFFFFSLSLSLSSFVCGCLLTRIYLFALLVLSLYIGKDWVYNMGIVLFDTHDVLFF